MKHNDAKTREEIRQAMQTALQQDDKEGFAAAMNDMMACIGEDIKQDYEDKIEQLRQENDSRALTSRGVRQLTSQENSITRSWARQCAPQTLSRHWQIWML